MKRAFEFWSNVANLEFSETSGSADIVISFESGDHNDGAPFDGAGNYSCSCENTVNVVFLNTLKPGCSGTGNNKTAGTCRQDHTEPLDSTPPF